MDHPLGPREELGGARGKRQGSGRRNVVSRREQWDQPEQAKTLACLAQQFSPGEERAGGGGFESSLLQFG